MIFDFEQEMEDDFPGTLKLADIAPIFKKNNPFEKEIIIIIITDMTQPAFTCSKLTIGTLEQGVKYVQS